MLVYHITTGEQYHNAIKQGSYTAPSLDSEGFIHASTYEQILGTANLIFRGQADLGILVIDTGRLTSSLQLDPVVVGNETKYFPHIYGSINMSAVIQFVDFPPQEDGSFQMPAGFPVRPA